MPPRSSLQAMADRNGWINKCLGPFAPWIVWHWGVCSTPFPRITSGTELTLSPVVTSWGFLGGSDGKESACNAGDLGSTPRLGRSPRGEHGNPLQYSCLENPHGQWCLVGYSPWGCKESDMIEQLSTAQWLHAHALFIAFFFLPCLTSSLHLCYFLDHFQKSHFHSNPWLRVGISGNPNWDSWESRGCLCKYV